MGLLDRHRRRTRELADSEEGPRGSQGVGIAALVGGAVVLLAVLFAVLLILLAARPASAQDLADYDYENLSFSGVMLDIGHVSGPRIDNTLSWGGRMDLGLLGPGVRATVGFNRWSSFLAESEVRVLEERLRELIFDQTGTLIPVDLGEISWSDVALHADLHLMWEVPLGFFTYGGLGMTAHILRGGGEAIEDTFIEDLLDSVRAGINAHGGIELPLHRNLRIVSEARFEVLENLRYLQFRLGAQFVPRRALR
jgi:hypothetical protein